MRHKIRIENEEMTYGAKTMTSFDDLERGVSGLVVDHPVGAEVFYEGGPQLSVTLAKSLLAADDRAVVPSTGRFPDPS